MIVWIGVVCESFFYSISITRSQFRKRLIYFILQILVTKEEIWISGCSLGVEC